MFPVHYHALSFSHVSPSVILGRAIKNEYLALGTLAATIGVGVLSTSGKKEAAPASAGKSAIEAVKDTVKFNAGSRCVSRCVCCAHYTD